MARHGMARHGTARHGTARHGTAAKGLRCPMTSVSGGLADLKNRAAGKHKMPRHWAEQKQGSGMTIGFPYAAERARATRFASLLLDSIASGIAGWATQGGVAAHNDRSGIFGSGTGYIPEGAKRATSTSTQLCACGRNCVRVRFCETLCMFPPNSAAAEVACSRKTHVWCRLNVADLRSSTAG